MRSCRAIALIQPACAVAVLCKFTVNCHVLYLLQTSAETWLRCCSYVLSELELLSKEADLMAMS